MLTPLTASPGAVSAATADPKLGSAIYEHAATMFPICRSITGDGVRETLRLIDRKIPIKVTEIASGTQVYDWAIPEEWTFWDAFIADSSGNRLIDAKHNALHVLSYSSPIDTVLTRAELAAHVQTLPNQPDLIPYRTSYYALKWGFCMSERQWQSLPDEPLHIKIDTSLAPGSLTYGEYIHHGTTSEEVLLSAHVCHPALANDNCSGLAVLTALAHAMTGIETRYTYRFLFAPGTIGALAWLSKNEQRLKNFKAGIVVSCLGDGGGPTVKRSRRSNTLIDRALAHVASSNFKDATIRDFSPYGYDERQYCSPGFNLPVASLQRSSWGEFPEYHTSADNLDFIRPEHLASSAALLAATIDVIEDNWTPVNLSPKGEPQLGRRGLYSTPTSSSTATDDNMATLWVLNLADGVHSLLDMAERSKMPFGTLAFAASRLRASGLLAPATTNSRAQ